MRGETIYTKDVTKAVSPNMTREMMMGFFDDKQEKPAIRALKADR